MALPMACLETTNIVVNVPKLIIEASKFYTNFAEVAKSDPSFTSWFHSRPDLLHPFVFAWCDSLRRLRIEDLEDFWSEDERKRVSSLILKTVDVIERLNKTRVDWILCNALQCSSC